MQKMKLFTCLAFLAFSAGLHAGNSDTSATKSRLGLPSIGAGFGVISYSGNVGNASKANVGRFTAIRPAFHFIAEERINPYFSLSLSGTFGHVAGNDHYTEDNLNFETKLSQYGLDIIFPFDNGILLKPGAMVVPYLSLGIGFISYRPFRDSLDAKGRPYYYWSDGSIRNLPEGSFGAVMLNRDYVYETPLSAAKSSITIPLGFGFKVNFASHLSARINVAYNYTFSKDIDGKQGASLNDKYLYSNVSLHYQFGKSKEEEQSNKNYDKVDWVALDNLDSDEDGVNDIDDMCPGTPWDVKVDAKGCPLDSDGDGVPDYLDKEPNTKKGSKVDVHGVKLDFKQIAANQKVIARYDSIYLARSKAFNAAPSMEKLREFEKQMGNGKMNIGVSNSNSKTNSNSSFSGRKPIPSDFKALDKDGNGLISVAELNSGIDSFFSGENALTVDQINKLIDFFFEQ
jgi:hypothetical protein